MIRKKRAKNLREGDAIVLRVERVMGVQGRKPRDGRAPLLKLQYDDGTEQTIRGDALVRVVRDEEG